MLHSHSESLENIPSWWKAKWLFKLTTAAWELWYNVPRWEEIKPNQLDKIVDRRRPYRSATAKVIDAEQTWSPDPLVAIFERWKWKTLMVRSNSLLEDGNHTFAWVYQSEKIDCTDIETLRNSLRNVLNSINSYDATKYRVKRKLWHDSMGIVLQEFVEGIQGWYGVIQSSLPQGDHRFAIAWGNHEEVTDGVWNLWQAEIYKGDYDEIPHGFPKRLGKFIPELKKIVIGLENRFGKSDIEYVIGKDETIHLVQLRGLNIPPTTPMIEWAEVVTNLDRWCPAYFVGLPVLVVESLENLFMQWIKNPLNIPELEWFHDTVLYTALDWKKVHRQDFANALHWLNPNLKSEPLWNWWDEVAAFNKNHPKWYVLSIPNWLPNGFWGLPFALWGAREGVEKELFSNMKAMVVTAFRSTHSNALAHASIRAREEDVPVIHITDNNFPKGNAIELKTGDILSIREWQLVRDKKVADIHDVNLLDFFKWIHLRDTPEFWQEIIFPWDEKRMEVFYNWLSTWLTRKTGKTYSKVGLNGHIWVKYICDADATEITISGYKMHPKYWALVLHEDFANLWLIESLRKDFWLKTDNTRYPEDFMEESTI
jgi:hypothetical protein